MVSIPFLSRTIGVGILGFTIGFALVLAEKLSQEASIELVFKKKERREVPLGLKAIYVGRSSEADIFIDHKSKRDILFYITFENGRVNTRNNEKKELDDGQVIKVEDYELIIHTS